MNEKRHNTDSRPADAPNGDELASLPLVADVLKALAKLIHGAKLYADNNPRLKQFGDDFTSALRAYFRKEDDLVLSIEQTTIRWNDRVVYENDKREDSIAFLLHKDGVGEITIGEPAIGEEIDALVAMLAAEYHSVAADEDIVTKFWNADFEHISYRVLDDYLAGEYKSAEDDDRESLDPEDHEELLPSLEDKGRVIVNRDDPVESIDGYLKRLILRGCTAEDEEGREAYFQSMVGSFFAVSNEELALYHDELVRETRGDALADFADAIIVFTRLQDNPSAVRDVSAILERICDYTVETRDPARLARLVELIKRFRTEQHLPEEIEAYCDKLSERLSAPALARELGESIETLDQHAEGVLRYIRAVGRSATDALLRAMHRVQGMSLHRRLSDTLVDIAGDEVDAVLDRLDIDNAAVAGDAVYIARKLGVTALTPQLRELLFYPDVKVKEEMIVLVNSMKDSEVPGLLTALIDDEDKRIRLKAIDAATQHGTPDVRSRLHALAFGKDLAQKDADEQEAIFRAVGRVGNAETVAHLDQMLERKSLVPFGKNKDNKVLVVRALENIQVAEAIPVLEKLVDDANNLVQTRAQRALAALREVTKAEVEA